MPGAEPVRLVLGLEPSWPPTLHTLVERCLRTTRSR